MWVVTASRAGARVRLLLRIAVVDLTVPLWLIDWLRARSQARRRVRVLVHRAVFLPRSPEHFFIKITNLSSGRDVEVTHIWFATAQDVHVLNEARPLPARLRPDETLETWKPVAQVPSRVGVERLVRVRLSTGAVVKSRLNKSIPPVGYVAGGGSA